MFRRALIHILYVLCKALGNTVSFDDSFLKNLSLCYNKIICTNNGFMNRFRTFMNRFSLQLALPALFCMLLPLQSFSLQKSSQQLTQTEQAVPSLASGSLLYADLDTANRRVLVLKEGGLWDYNLENKAWRFLDSLSALPLEIEDYEFGFDAANNKIKLWHRGIGTMYHIDPESYELERLDNSHVHRNQYAHQPFFRDGTVYAFGGYGYWLWKNYITYFNTELKEWNIQNVHPESEVPGPRTPETGIYIPARDEFYLFGGDMPDVNNRADDQFTGRSTLNDIWKFSFKDNTWTKIGTVSSVYHYYQGSSKRRYGRINKISGSFYSPNSMTWYIPTATEGRGDLVNLVPVDLSTEKVMKPIVLESGLNPDEFLPISFHFDREHSMVVIVGLKKITGTDSYPMQVITISEDSLLSRLESGTAASAMSPFLYAGGVILLSFVLLLMYWKRRKKSLGNLTSFHIHRDDIQRMQWFNEQERNLLEVLAESESYMESSELEEQLWNEIDNYDYRRKLRNETINAINRKFSTHYNTSSELISRIKDPEDNRRYLYGISEEFLDN